MWHFVLLLLGLAVAVHGYNPIYDKCDDSGVTNSGFEDPKLPQGSQSGELKLANWEASSPPPLTIADGYLGSSTFEGSQAVVMTAGSSLWKDVDVTGASVLIWQVRFHVFGKNTAPMSVHIGPVGSERQVDQIAPLAWTTSWEMASGIVEVPKGTTTMRFMMKGSPTKSMEGGVLIDDVQVGKMWMSAKTTELDGPQMKLGKRTTVVTTVHHTGPSLARVDITDNLGSAVACVKGSLAVVKGTKLSPQFLECSSSGVSFPAVPVKCGEDFVVKYDIEAKSVGDGSQKPLGNIVIGKRGRLTLQAHNALVVVDKSKPTGEQFVNNGDFETPALAGTGVGLYDSADVGGWMTSMMGGKIELWRFQHLDNYQPGQGAKLRNSETLFQDLAIPEGTTIEWSFRFEPPRGRYAVLGIEMGAPDNVVRQKTIRVPSGDWHDYSGTYTVPSGQTVTRFSVASLEFTEGYLDDVSVVPSTAPPTVKTSTVSPPMPSTVSPPMPSTASPTKPTVPDVKESTKGEVDPSASVNRIENGDFEIPDLGSGSIDLVAEDRMGGWKTTTKDHKIEVWRFGNTATQAAKGLQAVSLRIGETIYQDVAAAEGSTIAWSFEHQGRRRGTRAPVTIELGAPGQKGEVTNEASYGGRWYLHSGTYVVPKGQPITRFSLSNPRDVSYIDDVTLTVTTGGSGDHETGHNNGNSNGNNGGCNCCHMCSANSLF